MGKNTRRGTIAVAIAAAATLALPVGGAFAADDSDPIDLDGPGVGEAGDVDIFRYSDDDRIGTALEAAQAQVDAGRSGDTAILVSSEDFPDALAAATLADVLDAPILVTPNGDVLDERVSDFINANFDNVIIASGEGLLTGEIEEELDEDSVANERVSGANRYQTAVALANRTIVDGGLEDSRFDVFVADGTNYPDALAAGAAAAQSNGVVLLSIGEEGLDESTYDFITANAFGGPGPGEVFTIGGAATEGTPNGYDGNPVETDESFVGDDRYETAVLLAEEFFDNEFDGGPNDEATEFTIASGENYADAVVAGAFAANVDGPLLLTRSTSLSGATAGYISSEVDGDANVYIFGGEGSITPSVIGEIEDAIVGGN